MYEVKELFLEDVLKCTGYTSKIMEKYKKELLTLEDHKNKLEEWCQQREVKISDTIGKEAVEADEQIDEGVDVDKDEDLQVVTTEKELDTSEMEPWLIKDLDRCIMDVWLKGSDEAFSQLFHLIHSENVSVDYKHSETGATALMVAAGRGNMDNVEKLLNLGANVKVMSSNDWTAKDWAKAFNRTEIVDLLEAH
uniref:Probable ATP-dependent RNA helicase YTHDC2-like n=1 Tax=Saccoglossus kowalevskii TaxID=10224 RepID=A0ABM0M6T0_SACKO